MFTVAGKTLGNRKPLFADFSIPFPQSLISSESKITLRALLQHVVQHEVEAYNQRQEERSVIRVLTEKEIAQGAARGKIDMGGKETPPQWANANEAIQTAITAFQDGLFLVVLDEEELQDLDQAVPVTESSRLTFIRLSLLAGG